MSDDDSPDNVVSLPRIGSPPPPPVPAPPALDGDQDHPAAGDGVVRISAFDAPAVPLVPLAGLVILVDLGMLIAFTRQRKRAIAAAQDGHAGLPG